MSFNACLDFATTEELVNALAARGNQQEALLGLATTDDLFQELIARFRITGTISDSEFRTALNHNRARVLIYMLYGLSLEDRRYRTVDS